MRDIDPDSPECQQMARDNEHPSAGARRFANIMIHLPNCPRCEGYGEIVDVDGELVFCPECDARLSAAMKAAKGQP